MTTGILREAGQPDKAVALAVTREGALRSARAVKIETAPTNLDLNATPSISAGIDSPIVRITADQDCLILLGANPAITTANGIIHLAGQVDYQHTPGNKVAVLQLNAAGMAQIVGVSF